MAYVYILKSKVKSRLYIGITNDISRRLEEHNSGTVYSTKNLRPLSLVHQEECKDLIEARKREKYFKSGAGRRYLKKFNL
jgi:putative endonuclease